MERRTDLSISLTRDALRADPDNTRALEHLATLLVTRKRQYSDGLDIIERALFVEDSDAGLWYSAGWLYEFAAHEVRRRGGSPDLEPKALYERAAHCFRRCLALSPEGKLQGDAEDLLDHVQNELQSM